MRIAKSAHIVKPNACARARPTACVDSLPNARPPIGGQGHRIPQAGELWYKVPYTFRYKNLLVQSFWYTV